MAKIRIDKYLADAGFGSRKDVKGLLKAKQIGRASCRERV